MHQANPNLKILVYINGAFSYSPTAYPWSWYAHTVGGALVKSTAFGNYFMDMNVNHWLQNDGQECATERSTFGFDGCYFDMLTAGPMLPGALTGTPIDTRTGVAWVLSDYVQALVNAVAVIRTANPGVPIIANTLGSGTSYFKTDGTSTRPVLDVLDAGHEEDFLRTASQPVTQYPTLKGWLNAVNVLVDAGARGDRVLAQSKLWVTATAVEADAWYRFSVSTFLLGTNGLSYLTFSTDRTMAAATANLPYDHTNIGAPTSSYALVGGVYQRTFTQGLVLVNPTTASATVNLPGRYTDPDGGAVYQAGITLKAEQGVVLVKS